MIGYSMSNYTEEEIQEQLRYLGNARRVTSEERERVMTELGGRTRDSGPFSWVKCPVWRLRLNEVSRAGVVEGQTLSAILRYVLEGDRRSEERRVGKECRCV